MPDDGLFILATGEVAVTAAGELLQTVDEKCGECGCGGEVTGPCCITQPCTLVADAGGNWTYTAESSLQFSVSVPSAPWFSGGSGNSPAYGGSVNMAAARTATKAGLNWCTFQETHDYFWDDAFFPQFFDIGNIVTAKTSTATDPFYNPNASPSFGLDFIGATVTAAINLKQYIGFADTSGTLVGGAAQAVQPVLQTLHEFHIGRYLDTRGGSKTSRTPGFVRIRVAVYPDGTWAAWELSGQYISGSVSVTPRLAGTCVLGYTATLNLTTQANMPTVYSGSFAFGWIAGANGCDGNETAPATAESCGNLTYKGTFMAFPPEPMPPAVAQQILDETFNF